MDLDCAIPSLINVLVIVFAKLIIPDYITHVMSRSDIMLSFDRLPILIVQIIFLALAEEVAWRGFFQKQLQSILPALPAIIGTSVIFSLGHLTSGSVNCCIRLSICIYKQPYLWWCF
jgi:uncharacterized protein